MGRKMVLVRLDDTTHAALVRSRPEGLTNSEWVRLQVEVLVSFPAASAAHSELKDLLESPHRGGSFVPKSGPHAVGCRIAEDHWAALETMAQAVGRTRKEYLRLMIYRAGIYKGGWYAMYQKEKTAR